MLSDAEWENLQLVPVDDLVSLAAELDLVVPAEVDRRALLDLCIPEIVRHGRREGLPFSKYDQEDLAALPREHLRALARVQGLSDDANVAQIVRAGEKVYKKLRKEGRETAIALLLPSLLTAVAREAAG